MDDGGTVRVAWDNLRPQCGFMTFWKPSVSAKKAEILGKMRYTLGEVSVAPLKTAVLGIPEIVGVCAMLEPGSVADGSRGMAILGQYMIVAVCPNRKQFLLHFFLVSQNGQEFKYGKRGTPLPRFGRVAHQELVAE
jgi:hypothetical protein